MKCVNNSNMKNFIKTVFTCLSGSMLLTGCYKLQKDYQYVKYELDPHINVTAKDYLIARGSLTDLTGASDTVFKWMRLGIEYAGIDMEEYAKPGRTFIFLH